MIDIDFAPSDHFWEYLTDPDRYHELLHRAEVSFFFLLNSPSPFPSPFPVLREDLTDLGGEEEESLNKDLKRQTAIMNSSAAPRLRVAGCGF